MSEYVSSDNVADSDASSSVLLRMLGDETSPLVADLYTRYYNWVEENERERVDTRPMVKFSHYVKPEDLAYLAEVFPVFKFSVIPRPEAPIVRMEAFRYVLSEVFSHTDSWPGESVVFLDGSLIVNALRGRSYVHSCVSICDTEKHGRVLADLAYLNRISVSKPKKSKSKSVGLVDEYCARGEGPCEFFCMDPKECNVTAESVWIDHSTTNMSLVQLAHVMGKHNATRAFGTIVYDPAMIELGVDVVNGVSIKRTTKTGYLEALNAEWFIDTRSDTLTVVSIDDSQTFWVHSYSAWKQIVTEAGLFTDKHQFTWEVIGQYACFFVYRFIKHFDIPESDTLLVYKRWDNGCDKKVKFTNWRLKVGENPNYQSSWYPEEFLWPLDLYEKITKKAASATEKEFTMETLRRYLRDYNSTIVVSGVSVSEPKFKIYGVDADAGLYAIYLMNYKSRYEAGKNVDIMRESFKYMSKLQEAGLCQLGWLLISESFRSGAKAFSDIMLKRGVDFSITPTVEYVTGCRTYEVTIPKGGQRPVALSTWKHVFNKGFYSPVVGISGLAILQAFRKKKNGVANGVDCVSTPVTPLVDRLVDSISLVTLVEALPSVVAANAEASHKLVTAYDLGVARGTSDSYYEYESIVEPEDNVPAEVGDPLADVQDVMFQLFPKLTRNPLSARSAIMHTTDQEISVNATHNALNIAKMTLPSATNVADPRLLAPVEGDRPQTGLETIVAFNKRNNDAPYLRNPTDPLVVVQDMWDYLELGGFFAPDYEELLNKWNAPDGIVRPNVEDSDMWLNKASGATISQLLACDVSGVSDNVLNVYQLMIKAQVKPKLEAAAQSEYAALQTVVYHQKRVNALYSPLFVTLAQRFCRLLHPKIVIQMRKSAKGMQDAIRALVSHAGGYEGIRNFEGDISKFDKSQDHIALELEKLVYKKLGLDEACLTTWIKGCEYGEIASVAAGFRAFVAYQRKSGTGTTTLGNTIVNVFSVIRGFKLKINTIAYAVFLGDDSIVGYRGTTIELCAGTEYMSSVVNLQVKAYDNPVGYICSQYVVPDGDNNIVLMSDPVKRMASLGRPVKVVPDRSLSEEIHEKWVSFSDLMVNYHNPVYRENLDRAVSERVGCESVLRGIEALSVLRNDESKFVKFWESNVRQVVV